MHALLETLYRGRSLSRDESKDIFSQIVRGEVDNIVLSSLLTALKIKGEVADEIAGAADALLENAKAFPRPDYPFADIVGTGGDGYNTINISSASAIVAAAAGIKVAKHGNRSVSSKSGSADLLRTFGVNLDASPEQARACLDQSNLCFLFAPQYHGGIKHAMDVRTTLKTRTIFNLLGPLVNPARPSHIMIGVYLPELVTPFAQTLQQLGYKDALVVHGDGLDELAVHGPSQVAELRDSVISQYMITPEQVGLKSFPITAIEGGEPEQNQQLIEKLLKGQGEPAHQAAVAINTGALLYLTGKADSIKQGVETALEIIQSGKAISTIEACATLSQLKENQ